MKEIITNPILLILVSILTGQVLGKVSIKQIKLGSSAVMFTGLFFSYFVTSILIRRGEIETFSRYVPSVLFQISLIGFIVAVGLLAGKNMKGTIRAHGIKFLLLATLVTLTGALATFVFAEYVFPSLNIAVLGTYVGALTSSPGLATALEAVSGVTELEALIGVGYSISYIPGVAAVVLFVQLVGKSKRNKVLEKVKKKEKTNYDFCLMSFSFVCLLGVLLGQVKVYLGNYLGYFSLGTTGGVLVSSLIFGGIKSNKVFNFNFCVLQEKIPEYCSKKYRVLLDS
jgi:putative transport protein